LRVESEKTPRRNSFSTNSLWRCAEKGLQRQIRQLSMAQSLYFRTLKSFLRTSIRTWLMDQILCKTSRFLAIGVVTRRCRIRVAGRISAILCKTCHEIRGLLGASEILPIDSELRCSRICTTQDGIHDRSARRCGSELGGRGKVLRSGFDSARGDSLGPSLCRPTRGTVAGDVPGDA
jgi:hypothetical protein